MKREILFYYNSVANVLVIEFFKANALCRAIIFDQLPGSLRWTDLPDPAGGRPVNSRLIFNIENERGLCTILQSMHHRY
jgi:hypothetical protein